MRVTHIQSTRAKSSTGQYFTYSTVLLSVRYNYLSAAGQGIPVQWVLAASSCVSDRVQVHDSWAASLLLASISIFSLKAYSFTLRCAMTICMCRRPAMYSLIAPFVVSSAFQVDFFDFIPHVIVIEPIIVASPFQWS